MLATIMDRGSMSFVSASAQSVKALSSKSTPEAPALLPVVRCAQGRWFEKPSELGRALGPIAEALDRIMAGRTS